MRTPRATRCCALPSPPCPADTPALRCPRDDQTLAIVAAHGYAVALTSHVRIEPGRGLIGAVYRRGLPLLVRDVEPSRGRRNRARKVSHRVVRARTGDCGRRSARRVVPRRSGRRRAVLAGRRRAARRAGRANRAGAGAAAHRAAARTVWRKRRSSIPPAVSSTGPYFQSRLQEELQRATRQGTALSLQIIDVDSFKAVNDRFGHLAGDAIIKDVADILRRSVRVFDVCARYGGDEFAVVMPGSHLESAAAVADRIRLRIADRQPPVPHEPGRDRQHRRGRTPGGGTRARRAGPRGSRVCTRRRRRERTAWWLRRRHHPQNSDQRERRAWRPAGQHGADVIGGRERGTAHQHAGRGVAILEQLDPAGPLVAVYAVDTRNPILGQSPERTALQRSRDRVRPDCTEVCIRTNFAGHDSWFSQSRASKRSVHRSSQNPFSFIGLAKSGRGLERSDSVIEPPKT